MIGGKQNLVFTRVFDAPLSRAWKVWKDPELVKQWWGPKGFTSPSADIDFREGGMSLVCMRAPKSMGGQDMYSTWHYEKIVPLERIEYIHNLADKQGNTIDPAQMGMPADFPRDLRNSVAFKALDDNKTEITITEYDWPVGQMRELSKQGMEECLDKMAAALSTLSEGRTS